MPSERLMLYRCPVHGYIEPTQTELLARKRVCDLMLVTEDACGERVGGPFEFVPADSPRPEERELREAADAFMDESHPPAYGVRSRHWEARKRLRIALSDHGSEDC